MEDETPKPATGRAAKPPRSAHVIDLRSQAGAPAAARPEVKAPVAKPKAPKAAAKPSPEPEPLAPESIAEPATQPVIPPSSPTEFPDAPVRRRFWPAFWRFLVLLIILGLILVGGVYLYLHRIV